MRSEITENRFYIECGCHSPEHLLIFDFDEKFEIVDIYISGNYRQPFLARLLIAFKFIFFKKPYTWTDALVINSNNKKQLIEILEKIQ